MAQSEMDGSRTTPHSTVSSEEAVGDWVGPGVGGAGLGVDGVMSLQAPVVATEAQPVCGEWQWRVVARWLEGAGGGGACMQECRNAHILYKYPSPQFQDRPPTHARTRLPRLLADGVRAPDDARGTKICLVGERLGGLRERPQALAGMDEAVVRRMYIWGQMTRRLLSSFLPFSAAAFFLNKIKFYFTEDTPPHPPLH